MARRDAARAVDEAGWGRTAFAAAVSLVYFFPVLVIILTAFKVHADALAVPAKLFPTTLFGLIPERFTFEPTLAELRQRVLPRLLQRGRGAGHRLQPLLLQLDLHRRGLGRCSR